MSRKYTLKEDIYLVLVKYFKAKVVMLNKKDLDDYEKEKKIKSSRDKMFVVEEIKYLKKEFEKGTGLEY